MTLVRPALTLTLLLGACLPGKGEVKILGDGTGAIVDGTGMIYPEGGPPNPDLGPAADKGPKPDGLAPDTTPIPKPDTTPAGPKPPFGSVVGVTAANFIMIPDCADKPYTLHDYYNTNKGVLVAMMSPS